jgi:hypothetical protein
MRIDRKYPDDHLCAGDTCTSISTAQANWERTAMNCRQMKLLAGHTYIYPDGYKVASWRKHPHAPSWRLVGTGVEGTFCHKPCTVSGGGKSEISKSLGRGALRPASSWRTTKSRSGRMQRHGAHDFSERFKVKKRIVIQGAPPVEPNAGRWVR